MAMANLDLARVERLRATVERASATVGSPDHAVRVTVGPGGAVTELALTNQALRRGGRALAGLIAGLITEATAELDRTLAAELGDLTGRTDQVGLMAGSLPEPAPVPDAHRDGRAGAELAGGELVDRLREASARSLEGYARLREELAGMTCTARSADGTVTVTVDSGGALRDLRIDDAAVRHGPGNLARLVQATLAQARADASLHTAERVQELAGPALSIQDMVASAIPPALRPDPDRHGA